MVADAGFALTKLLLGLAVFVALGYFGRFYDKRLAGMLLTFPILNSIGILTGDDPLVVANSIYAVVALNGLILFFMIGHCQRFPRLEGASPNTKLAVRVALWTAIWAAGATLMTAYRDYLPGIAGLLLLQAAMAIAAVVWRPQRRAADSGAPGANLSLPSHAVAMIALWGNPSGVVRMVLFTACFGLLFVAAHLFTSKWVGMFSAVPLPGLFAIATLSVMDARDDFALMRDTVLIGAFSVNVFNWIYAQIVFHLPDGGVAHDGWGILALVVMMAADTALIFWITPQISAYLNRVRP